MKIHLEIDENQPIDKNTKHEMVSQMQSVLAKIQNMPTLSSKEEKVEVSLTHEEIFVLAFILGLFGGNPDLSLRKSLDSLTHKVFEHMVFDKLEIWDERRFLDMKDLWFVDGKWPSKEEVEWVVSCLKSKS